MTVLAALAFAYLAIIERGPTWLRTLCVAVGLVGNPFWMVAGLVGGWAGGPRIWTIAVALAANVILWGALFYVFAAIARSGRRGAPPVRR
jgi:hypothetical protein